MSKQVARSLAGAVALASALVATAPPAPADAETRVYRPVGRQGSLLKFRLSGLRPSRIGHARFEVGRRARVLSLKAVRAGARRGTLWVRAATVREARLAAARRSRASGRRRHRARVVITIGEPASSPPPGTQPPGGTGAPGGIAGCSSASTAFGVDAWPGACWRPYAASSPFNRPLPPNARTAANSAAIVSRVVGLGGPNNLVAGNADTATDWGHPTYYARASDPVYRLHCTESWGRCGIEGMQIRIPSPARPAGGDDGHMTVVQPDGWEYDMWRVASKPAGGGTLNLSWGDRTRIDGDGRGSGATAAEFGNLAGIIRAQEMAAGRIEHALFMTVRCDNGTWVYPATKTGARCSAGGESDAGAPPMGSRFQLAMSDAQIDALSVPAWKKTILRAMAHYGMYMGDTGSGSWGIQFESGSTYTSFGREDAMVTFARGHNVPAWNGHHVFNVRDGVDWGRYLRVVDPCVSQQTC